jgi:hypothetical protein
MRERAAIAVGAAAIASLLASASGAAPRTCGPASAHTLARNSVARIYSPEKGTPLRPSHVFGCTFASGHVVSLGATVRQSVGHVALGGTFAGYGLRQMGVDTSFTRVRVMDLRTGRVIVDAAATSQPMRPESFTDVTVLVLNAHGHVAWIGSMSSIGLNETTYEVRKVDGPAEALLDASSQIDPTSLHRHGRRITWKHGRVTRSASLS